MQFSKLRLSGFKSFVEPSELVIDSGLTGVVGPNGCGKSNLVEALRWVMGETSAKRMRGGAMDDVIFAGTQHRPARNIAEVQLIIENKDRTAPAAFNDADELVVSRTIEREAGSAYRVNGTDVRARDVQLLFADAASGAHSPSLVSQGRIGAIVNAKPVDRRSLLEEAAGITGLHSRRHEAELRLRAAEANLERLDDVMQALEAQLQNIKRQARQANRYRKLGEEIRRYEAMWLHQLFLQSQDAMKAASDQLREAEAEVAALTSKVAEANTVHLKQSEGLPVLRYQEAEASAGLHRLAAARDALDQEDARIAAATAEAEGRLRQLGVDEERERTLAEDAVANVARLNQEREQLVAQKQGDEAAQAAADSAVQQATQAVSEQERELEGLTGQVANQSAQQDALKRAIGEADGRIGKLQQRLRETSESLQRLEAELARDSQLARLKEEATDNAEALENARRALEAAEEARKLAEARAAQASEQLQEPRSQDAALAAEEKALKELLQVAESELWPPLIDAVTVEPGYEAALGAALGDELAVPSDEAAPVHWRTLAPYDNPPALPDGVQSIADVVRGPDALRRRLSQIGVVDEADGPRLAAALQQGQRLVSRSGALWRWDGYTVTAAAESAAALRLRQRNRLEKVREEREAASLRLAAAEADRLQAKAEADKAVGALQEIRGAARRAEQAFSVSRDALARAERETAARSSRLAALTETRDQVASDLAETQSLRDESAGRLAQMPPLDDAREKLAALRRTVSEARTALMEARNRQEQLRREIRARAARIEAIAGEVAGWQQRADSAAKQLAELAQRGADVTRQLEELREKPAAIAARRNALLEQIAEMEATRTKASDALTTAENQAKELEKALRAAEQTLAQARENRVRREGAIEQARERREDVVRRIREALECVPAGALAAGGIDPEETLLPLDEAERRVDRLKKERDRMGPVNLRAEQEAVELEEQLQTMRSEREDLEGAIARLRRGIASLNKEGRERLLEAFKTVDEHFQSLFVRLFGGGKAHLALVESDDPLEAGLEIMASPPGKRLQTLSLLSGGEQALTALSLLFAVFMTNPAPVCVLDEVDAPLDDANVERFTNLVQEIARVTGTRFLIITHHPYTMARMDRLFGVTMGERGVSTLVSVDLARAERIRATA